MCNMCVCVCVCVMLGSQTKHMKLLAERFVFLGGLMLLSAEVDLHTFDLIKTLNEKQTNNIKTILSHKKTPIAVCILVYNTRVNF